MIWDAWETNDNWWLGTLTTRGYSSSIGKEELLELLYADDLAILAETEEELQRRLVEWQEALDRKGLKANARETEVMVCTREVRVEADISDKKKYRLKQVETFTYLCSMISESGGCEGEMRHRVGA